MPEATARLPSKAARLAHAAKQKAVCLLEERRGGKFVLDCCRAVAAVARGFRGEKISLRASALTYITMLSLVPLLAVAFAIIHAVGQDGLRHTVHEFVFTNLAPGAREQIGSYLDEFIARANASAMGGLGGFFLLVSAVSLLHNIETSINEIWGVSRPRPLLQRSLIYWAVLTLGPVGLGISLLATSAMRSAVESTLLVPRSALALVPVGTTVTLLTFLYVAAPNARVRLRAAFGGAAVAGIAWEIAKHGYAIYAARSIRYSAIYGSLGAIPLFLLWVYVSWLLMLFGARLAYALQYAAGAPADARAADARAREVLCARVAVAAAADFLSGSEPSPPARLARTLGIDPPLVAEAIRALKDGGVVAELSTGAVVPTRPPGLISLLDVSRAAEGTLFCHSAGSPTQEAATRSLCQLFAEADRSAGETLARSTLESLAAPFVRQAAERKVNTAG